MGWLFKSGSSLKELIEERTRSWKRTTDTGMVVTTTCLAHCYRGGRFSGVLWTVWERTFVRDEVEAQPNERWIGCDLLRHQDGAWGYKDLDESMHPFYFSCPLKYLDMVPLEHFGGNAEWRETVRAHHDRQKQRGAGRRNTS